MSLTPLQYGSSAGIAAGSDNLKIPCLKTSFESEFPISSVSLGSHVMAVGYESTGPRNYMIVNGKLYLTRI